MHNLTLDSFFILKDVYCSIQHKQKAMLTRNIHFKIKTSAQSSVFGQIVTD